jgi:hypothetical protein
MCFKKKPPPVIISPVKRRVITFGKNLYEGQNLNGCWNDSLNIGEKFPSLYPDFDVRKFRDYDVTAGRYLSELKGALQVSSPGSTVLVMADSCFSETITRKGLAQMSLKHPTNNRFYDLCLHPRKDSRKLFSDHVTTHIVMSGCMEHETSADAFINGKYVGAFTFFALHVLRLGMTYKQWYEAIRTYLPSQDFTQTPTLEGPDFLINRKVFEDETLVIHNSSHGSYYYDRNGDEEDGQDEGLYFDRLLLDDEIGEVLKMIKQVA